MTSPETIKTAEAVATQGLQLIVVHVPDVNAARSFYTETLGLTVANDTPGFVLFAPREGAGASIAIAQESLEERGTEIWWYVADADAALAEFKAHGVRVVGGPIDKPFGRYFIVADPAGNWHSILQLAAR